jgi:hypothetical protein
MPYWLRLARPDWTAAVVVVAIGLSVAFVHAGLADDVAGSINAGRLVAAVLSIGVAAAFLDPAAPVSDAAPYPRLRRRLIPPALSLVALAVAGAALAITQAARVAGVPWPGLLLQAAGLLSLSAATAAAFGNRADPGILAAITVVGLITLDARSPWGPILTAAPADDWGRANLLWATLIAGFTGIVAVGLRDPAARPRPTVHRKSAMNRG